MPKSEAELNQIMLRRNYRRVLRATMEAIDIPKTHYIEPELCEKANIVQQPLSLDEESDYQPFFFDECQGNIMSYSEAGKDDPREHPPLEYDPDSTAAWNVLGLMANIELSWLDRNPLNETGGCVTVSYVPYSALEGFSSDACAGRVFSSTLEPSTNQQSSSGSLQSSLYL